MRDERLTQALQELPRERASHGFTGRVLARLDEPEKRPLMLGLPRLSLASVGAIAAAVLLLAVGLGARQWTAPAGSGDEAAEARALLEEIRAEHERLERELTELEAAGAPVLYLGGDERVDLVLDLGRVPERPAGRVQPAHCD